MNEDFCIFTSSTRIQITHYRNITTIEQSGDRKKIQKETRDNSKTYS